MKKKWFSPKLIVLVRNQLEESILVLCKAIGGNGVQPAADDTGCTEPACQNCDAISPS